MPKEKTTGFYFKASPQEMEWIKQRMAQCQIRNLSAYLRKMAIDGYHITLDLSDVREMVRLLKNATNNINQIARRANETRNIYAADIEDLRQRYSELWPAVNKILSGLAGIK